ncbi:MAG: insulinase family protein [Prolixibacteraceae bacterium]|jgi:zinc protease|nr:insulinase family protein [Prolixibacteraceae bacterium]
MNFFNQKFAKGTEDLGTINYKEEKVYLDSIVWLYDELGNTNDEEKRADIQKEINRISVKAAGYAIPNEFDKVVKTMGGDNVNAGTSYEFIIYYNSFPANQINKWIELYSHRFEKPVFRLFQSELETVYEEKNMYADDIFNRLLEEFNKNFYRQSPYGQQTILVKVEHLKNPSLSKMKEYFDTYYVANNMALVLAGDIEPEEIKPLIEEKFGNWRSGDLPPDLKMEETPFKGREYVKERLTPIKVGILGYQTIPKNHTDELALEVCSKMLTNNSSTGLLNQLANDNKLMEAFVFSDAHAEIGGHFIGFLPKVIGQSLKNAENEIQAQVSRLKTGNFDEELLRGVKTEIKKEYEKWLENMRWRTYAIMDAFLYDISWDDYLLAAEKVDKISKEDVMVAANKYFGDNYLAFYSKMGFPKKTKLEKPPYKPVAPQNADTSSAYAQKIENIPVKHINPRFIDFDDDVSVSKDGDVGFFVTPNPVNKIFSIRLVYGKGIHNDKLVKPTASLIQYARPNEMELSEFKTKMQLLGCNMYAYSNQSKTMVNVEGLEENLIPTLEMLNKLLKNPSVDEKQLKKLLQEHKFELKYEKKSLWDESDALQQYALYNNQSEYLHRLSTKEIRKIEIDEINNKLKEILGYEFEVHYCGSLKAEEFKQIFKANITIPEKLKTSPGHIELDRNKYNENTIFVVKDKKAIQSHINILIEGAPNNEESKIRMEAFNDYIGGNMSSIVFQEIREFRSLAYGTSARYNASYFNNKPGYFKGWLSTQSDKTIEAIDVFTTLISDLPQKPERIEQVRNNLTLSINANQPMFRHKSNIVSRWLDQGYNADPRESRYDNYQTITFDEINTFYNNNLKDKSYVITVVGDTKRINMDELAKYGKIKALKRKDIFND